MITGKLMALDDYCLEKCTIGMSCKHCIVNVRIEELMDRYASLIETDWEEEEKEEEKMGEIIFLDQYREKSLVVFATSVSSATTYHLREDCPRLSSALYKVKIALSELKLHSPEVKECKFCGNKTPGVIDDIDDR